MQKAKNRNTRYNNNIHNIIYNPDDTLITLPANTVWKGIEKFKKHNRKIKEIKFENVKITEAVVKRHSVDIKIIQFLFQSKSDAEKSKNKLGCFRKCRK